MTVFSRRYLSDLSVGSDFKDLPYCVGEKPQYPAVALGYKSLKIRPLRYSGGIFPEISPFEESHDLYYQKH